MHRHLLGALCLLLLAASPPPKPSAGYRLELEVNPVAMFPLLTKLGEVDLTVYPGGVHGQTFLLKGFSRNHTSAITVQNPLARTYSDISLADITAMLGKFGKSRSWLANRKSFPLAPEILRGSVKGVPASRYRVMLAPEAWVDVWTTTVIPENPQFERIMTQVAASISPAVSAATKQIPGTVLYVELNTPTYPKVPVLRMKKLVRSSEGESDALQVGAFYFKKPFSDSMF